MNDLELNRKLALAIGYQPKHLNGGTAQQWVLHNNMLKCFDYRDWKVIGPIAAKYDCFPYKWNGFWESMGTDTYVYADTPQAAIALAVIQGAGK